MSRLFYIYPILGIFLFCAVPVLAQQNGAEPEFTISELVQRALDYSPRLEAARQSQKAAQEYYESARSFANPTLELVPRLAGDKEAAESEVLLSQSLDIFGKRRADANVKKAEIQIANAESTFEVRSLIYEVKKAAIDLFVAQERESLNAAQEDIAQKFYNVAQRRAELGDVPQVQPERAELELLRAQNELSNAKSARLMQLATLNLFLGQAPETSLRVKLPAPNLNPSSNASQNQLLVTALTNRADLQIEQATLVAQEAQIAAIDRQRLPDIQLQLRRGSLLGGENTYAVRAAITMPLFDFGSLKHARRAAQAKSAAQSAHITQMQMQIATEVQQALLHQVQQRDNVEHFRKKLVPQTLELMRKTQIGYEQGASTYLEVLEAQHTSRQVQSEYLQAVAEMFASEAALEKALGQV